MRARGWLAGCMRARSMAEILHVFMRGQFYVSLALELRSGGTSTDVAVAVCCYVYSMYGYCMPTVWLRYCILLQSFTGQFHTMYIMILRQLSYT